VQIRNRATLTGNICNASPAADTAPALLAYGAAVVLISRHGSRRVPLDEFMLGPRRTSLGAHEIAAAVDIPVPPARTGSQFARLTRRRGVDLATVSLCCTVGSLVTRFAFGAVGPRPFVLTDGSGVLADPDSDPRRAGGAAARFRRSGHADLGLARQPGVPAGHARDAQPAHSAYGDRPP